ncbi:Ger(x)C family spore germination protein [Paenibacillus cymbidii]|uniref:Ger(x)C family spore germination protein n=1 Tax=Paenibacillus cymbidii TaxID=1639034 RepID=UPI0014367979|nr:Ger(x)C family spore germination protein [Paenibacillus cymbidii]
MLKRCFLCLLIAAISVVPAGCWDRTEITDLAITLATGVDAMPDNQIRTTVQLILPLGVGQQSGGSGVGGTRTFLIETTSGVDLRDTIGNLQEKLSRKMFVAQRRILIVGEELARRGIQPMLDHFSRDPRSRMRTYIMVAKGSTATDILKTPYLLEKEPAEALRDMQLSGISRQMDLKDVYQAILSDQDLAIPTIELVQQGETRQSTFKLAGVAIFHKDKLVGMLDGSATRGLMWLVQEAKTAIITVPVPDMNGFVSATVLHSKSSLKAKKEEGKIVLRLKTRATVDIMENTTSLDLTEPANVEAMQHLLADKLRSRIESTIDALQHQYKADVVGFGKVIDRTYPRDWKALQSNWHEEFPHMKIAVVTSITVRGTGMSGQSLSLPEITSQASPTATGPPAKS